MSINTVARAVALPPVRRRWHWPEWHEPTRAALIRSAVGTVLPFLTTGVSAGAEDLVARFRRTPVAAAPARVPFAGPVNYVAIGASDAVGWGVPVPHRDGWVPLLAGHLPQPSTVLNLGVGGTTLRRALEMQLPHALRAQPDLVTVWLAVNDVLGRVPLDQYRADLHALLSALRAETGAVIAVGNVPYPPAVLDPWGFPDFVRQSVAAAWNAVIAAVARRHNAVLVDIYRRWRLTDHPEFIGPDGLHPSVHGYRALADVFAGTLREHHVL